MALPPKVQNFILCDHVSSDVKGQLVDETLCIFLLIVLN